MDGPARVCARRCPGGAILSEGDAGAAVAPVEVEGDGIWQESGEKEKPG